MRVCARFHCSSDGATATMVLICNTPSFLAIKWMMCGELISKINKSNKPKCACNVRYNVMKLCSCIRNWSFRRLFGISALSIGFVNQKITGRLICDASAAFIVIGTQSWSSKKVQNTSIIIHRLVVLFLPLFNKHANGIFFFLLIQSFILFCCFPSECL